MTDEAYSRMLASAVTWPVEKSKLIYQGSSSRSSLRRVAQKLVFGTSPTHHAIGMASSGIQRGVSAYLMFYLQGHIYQSSKGMTPSFLLDQAIAGACSGALSAPVHTVWELFKVRGNLNAKHSLHLYSSCLFPMICRHGIFDMTFFGVAAAVAPYSDSSGVRFAVAAASASFMNLLWDVWKTQQMEHYPKRIPFRQVVQQVLLSSRKVFLAHYIVKGTDLTANWFAVGVIKDAIYGAL